MKTMIRSVAAGVAGLMLMAVVGVLSNGTTAASSPTVIDANADSVRLPPAFDPDESAAIRPLRPCKPGPQVLQQWRAKRQSTTPVVAQVSNDGASDDVASASPFDPDVSRAGPSLFYRRLSVDEQRRQVQEMLRGRRGLSRP